ncbi:unnamed protein product [Amaranthus hypochondriacus]
MATSDIMCFHTSLTLVTFEERFAFTCNICRELGYGACYTCHPECNYHVHTDCHMIPPTISHPFFSHSQFVLDQHEPSLTDSCCEACGMGLKGWRYVLTNNGLNSAILLHPCCMKLPSTNKVSGVSFTLEDKKLENLNVCCSHCQGTNGVNGWAYVSTKLKLALHVKCGKDMLHENWAKIYYGPNYDHAVDKVNNNDSNENGFQERSLNGNNENDNKKRRFRKRDLLFGAANFALNVTLYAVGLGDATETVVNIMLMLAGNIWGGR